MYQINIIKVKKDYKKGSLRYQYISKEEKENQQQYDQEWFKNLSEDKRQKSVEYIW